MKIAVVGCGHGCLDEIYASLQHLARVENISIDLLLICGDFQALRNEADMLCLACPPKYRHMGSFHKYYSGRKKAPVKTLFIGGNHEASNYLWELYYGGWVCENIYFLGFSGVVRFGGLRIGGLSGIYKANHHHQGYFERMPYSEGDMRSIYHVRRYEIEKLLKIREPLDVFLSHDWPQGIEQHGNLQRLLRGKPFFRKEVESNTLGSPPARLLLDTLRPRYWFSAHLHVKFAAIVRHDAGTQNNPDEIALDVDDLEEVENPDRIDFEISDEEAEATPQEGVKEEVQKGDALGVSNLEHESQPRKGSEETRFLALDKCLPNRDFLQIVDFPDVEGPHEFAYDEEWLAILRTYHEYLSLERMPKALPDEAIIQSRLRANREWARSMAFGEIPKSFVQTAEPYDPQHAAVELRTYENPQTTALKALITREAQE
ncbi:uncharacterized protein VTP21DRAFT_1147 [Calcarisporiella thermophila]|uniref:uncharacterized protein n=1 Tax=Calcarisporiella thermophila TaxID=911321 RepID=UPI0037442FD6